MKILLYSLMACFLLSCSRVEREYYPNGNLKSEIELNHKKEINGTKTTFYENKQIQSLEYYTNNIKNGEFTSYYPNGNIQMILRYKNGVKDSTLKSFYEDGTLQYTYNYVNDKINGDYREYFNNGDKKEIRFYDNDSLLFYEIYDSTGNFIKDYRKIDIECKSDTIKLGETFKALIELKGPKVGTIEYSAIDALPSELKVKEVFSKYLPIVDDKGLYEYKPNKTGYYKILGSIRIKYDSITYPRYYDFEKIFFVQEK
jgi:hypothetical protein